MPTFLGLKLSVQLILYCPGALCMMPGHKPGLEYYGLGHLRDGVCY